jgi:ABC-2 type transport system permease protein
VSARAASAAARYLRLAREFARVGVIRKSQFRVDFLTQVVMDAAWYAVHVATFEILFEHTDAIAGWGRDETRVFLGMLFVSDAFWMMWLGQSWHFSRELKDGVLDSLRLRPGSPVFLYFFQRFSLEACVNAAMAVAWLGYALSRIEGALSLSGLALLVWALALACWCRTVLSVLYTVSEFYVVHSDLSNVAWEVSMNMADRPADVFPLRFRQLLTSVVPVAALSTLPAAMVLGRIGPLEALAHTAWLALLGLGVFRLWRWSFRSYQSALS